MKEHPILFNGEMVEPFEVKPGGIMVYSASLEEQTKSMVIATDEDLKRAVDLKAQCKNEIKKIEEAIKPRIDLAHQLHKDLISDKKKGIQPFEEILTDHLNPKILAYQVEQEKLAKEKQEAEEKKRREEEAEANRIAEEEKAKHVEALREAGDTEKAEMIEQAPTPKPVSSYVPKEKEAAATVKGAGTRKTWKARPLDFSKIDDKFKIFDQAKANKMAAICKDETTEPGMEFYQEAELSGR